MKMKILNLILVGAMVLVIPAISSAATISLTVGTTITGGTALPPSAMTVIDCPGYKTINDPFTDCTVKPAGTIALKFHGKLETDPLVTVLYDSLGNPTTSGAGCFYAVNYNIVYLFPDAWGGAGYQITQAATVPVTAIANALAMTPVYSEFDKYRMPDGTFVAQGIWDTTKGDITKSSTPVLATSGGGVLFSSRRPRIVRLEYGIPPNGGPSPKPAGWIAVPLTTAAGSYAASITITMTQI